MTAARPTEFNLESAFALPKLPIHDATRLTSGGNQALIALGEQIYHLRITRAGKLILTK